LRIEKIRRLGIRQEIIAAILDQRFSWVFGTQTLGYWVEDTLKVNYATLLRLKRLQDREEEGSMDKKLWEHCEVIDHPPEELDDYTILYKAMASTSSLDSHPLFMDDGTLNISTLSSPRGGDFNGQDSAVYLTPQRQTAELYRRYISLRCPYSSTYLVCLSIPNIFLSSLRMEEVYFSETWKELIWCCRRKQPVPEHLQHLGKADVVKGYICTKPDIARLSLQDLPSKVTEDDIFVHEDGQKGIQWCFREEKVREVMGLGAQVHVGVFGPSSCAKD
jgi:hypothetical protein